MLPHYFRPAARFNSRAQCRSATSRTRSCECCAQSIFADRGLGLHSSTRCTPPDQCLPLWQLPSASSNRHAVLTTVSREYPVPGEYYQFPGHWWAISHGRQGDVDGFKASRVQTRYIVRLYAPVEQEHEDEREEATGDGRCQSWLPPVDGPIVGPTADVSPDSTMPTSISYPALDKCRAVAQAIAAAVTVADRHTSSAGCFWNDLVRAYPDQCVTFDALITTLRAGLQVSFRDAVEVLRACTEHGGESAISHLLPCDWLRPNGSAWQKSYVMRKAPPDISREEMEAARRDDIIPLTDFCGTVALVLQDDPEQRTNRSSRFLQRACERHRDWAHYGAPNVPPGAATVAVTVLILDSPADYDHLGLCIRSPDVPELLGTWIDAFCEPWYFARPYWCPSFAHLRHVRNNITASKQYQTFLR